MRITKPDGSSEFIPDVDSLRLAIREGRLSVAVDDAAYICRGNWLRALKMVREAIEIVYTDKYLARLQVEKASEMYFGRYMLHLVMDGRSAEDVK